MRWLFPTPRPVNLISEVVVQQFERSWRSATTCPQVRAIYKVVSTQQSVNKYNFYWYVTTPPVSFPKV